MQDFQRKLSYNRDVIIGLPCVRVCVCVCVCVCKKAAIFWKNLAHHDRALSLHLFLEFLVSWTRSPPKEPDKYEPTEHIATHRNTLQHTATYCNILGTHI